MDGWFSPAGAFDSAWFQLPSNHHLGERDWSHVDAFVVSHEHLDHFDPGFLRHQNAATPLYVASFGSPRFVRKIQRMTGRTPEVLETGRAYQIGEIRARAWSERSPMNQDSVWAFTYGGRSIVHSVDSRLSIEELDEILEFTGGPPDLLLLQCSGASWYPLVYEIFSPEEKRARSITKREHKLAYARSVASHMRPGTLVINAGPPVFLDPQLRHANADPSFPTPGESQAWFAKTGYRGRVEAPLPGDEIDLRTGEMTEDPAMHGEFSWAGAASCIEPYARRCEPAIAAACRHADELRVIDMDAAVRGHFTAMLALSSYFNERIDLTLCLDIEGPQSGRWLIDFGRSPGVRKARDGNEYQYRYTMHSRWLKRILVEKLPWEDFFLSLRFTAYRNPDIYNDHLLGLMKFNERASLTAVEKYERSLKDDTIVRAAPDGTRYEIARYCPHAGAALDHAPIEGHLLTCLNHHYSFDLETGRCLTGNCVLRARKLS